MSERLCGCDGLTRDELLRDVATVVLHDASGASDVCPDGRRSLPPLVPHAVAILSLSFCEVCSSGCEDDALAWVREACPAGTRENWCRDPYEPFRLKPSQPKACVRVPGRAHFRFVTLIPQLGSQADTGCRQAIMEENAAIRQEETERDQERRHRVMAEGGRIVLLDEVRK